jgi:hypothetical protein
MYVNGTIRLVELFQLGRNGVKENVGGGEFCLI